MTEATPSDLELLARARRGDSSATAELYARHAGAARRLAATYPRAGDPDDLVNEAFERVLGALRRGSGPEEAFRAYLFVTLRRVAAEQAARLKDEPMAEVPDPVEAGMARHGPAFDPADRQIILSAYKSLPDRQQAVLWHTAVEGRPPRDLAPVLGVSANAVSALASRAREQLREAYLQAHLQVPPPPNCEPHRSRLGAFVRDGLSARDKSATEAHVEDCHSCRDLVLELYDVNQLLVQALHPLFLSSAAAGAAGAAEVGAGAAGRAGAARRAPSKMRSIPVAIAAAVAAAALVAALVGVRIGDDEPSDLAAPVDQALTPADSPEHDEPGQAPTTRSERPAEANAETPPPRSPRARQSDPVEPSTATDAAPATAGPTSSATPSPPAEPTAPPSAPNGPPASVPSTTAPPTTQPPPGDPTMGPVVWFPESDQLQITLANDDDEPTDHLALGVRLDGGAVIGGWPTGCQMASPLVWSAGCAVNPVAPGSETVVRVPITVTGPGQTARVSLCAVRLLSVDCDTDILNTTTTQLTS
jgi:RNA polymerase sigma factor (sigma-70 family)